jgi:transposase
MQDYPRSQWERIMKIQEVFGRAYENRITWREASLILGVDERTIRRWKHKARDEGFESLLDQRTRMPSPKRAPERIKDQVKKLYREMYWEWNVKHFHEQLAKHGIKYEYTWTKNLLQDEGLVQIDKKRTTHRRKRPRKPLVGMMLHIDGSDHEWIPLLSGQRQSLILVVDDANNDIYHAKLAAQETTKECMLGLKSAVVQKGLFCSVYSDRAEHFFHTPKAGGKVDLSNLTQIGRAMYELGIEMIPAYSPEARGRSERMNGTWQGRLPDELKLHGINNIPDANQYILETFLPDFKKRFAKTPHEEGSAFTPYRGRDLELVFSVKEQRTVNADNTVQWRNKTLQIEKSKFRISFAKCKVMVHDHLDGKITIIYGHHVIGRYMPDGSPITTKNKEVSNTYPHIHSYPQRKRKATATECLRTPKRTNHLLLKADILTCY